jgi:hypothetical protein
MGSVNQRPTIALFKALFALCSDTNAVLPVMGAMAPFDPDVVKARRARKT